jgi:fermentation-respiration switch protein FrsA (DUF1100 family)
LLNVGDHADLLNAIVPRPLLVIVAEKDVGMSVEALREMDARGKEVYAKHQDAFKVHVGAGGHNLTPQGLDLMAEWFQKHLD